MKKTILTLIVFNALIAAVNLIVFYFFSFLSGYASSVSKLPLEKRLFIKFVSLHVVASIFLLYRFKQFNLAAILVSLLVIASAYLLAAWQFGYFH